MTKSWFHCKLIIHLGLKFLHCRKFFFRVASIFRDKLIQGFFFSWIYIYLSIFLHSSYLILWLSVISYEESKMIENYQFNHLIYIITKIEISNMSLIEVYKLVKNRANVLNWNHTIKCKPSQIVIELRLL